MDRGVSGVRRRAALEGHPVAAVASYPSREFGPMHAWIAITLAATITALLSALAVACTGDPAPGGELEVTSGRSPNASVSGSVTYRERIALTEGARLVVELRDVSYQDAAAPLIARQTIENPGQVPIRFEVGYHRDDIDDRNVYGISARIIAADGRLAFTNDTAYDVITRGNPRSVDMLLVLVEPPPGLVPAGTDWRTWVETPVQIVAASLVPFEPDHPIRVVYYQSGVENCARPGNEGWEIDGARVRAWVTLMQPPPTPWGIDCDAERLELDTYLVLGSSLVTGQTYEVVVNDVVAAAFTLPEPSFGHTAIAESPVERAEVVERADSPASYDLHVVSGLPKGSGCSWVNGHEVERRDAYRIDITVTHHENVEPDVVCTADFPIIETTIPLGSAFEPGEEYTVTVNGEVTVSFTPGE
ncbi:MAG: hypothetical protein F4X26_03690 [Chloroflexi bacterium]|nr:hypothetical protein [Chloroflexota bacterium]